MKTDDFDYYLPKELIAQTPLEKRDESRLLVLDKKTGEVEHKKFYDIVRIYRIDTLFYKTAYAFVYTSVIFFQKIIVFFQRIVVF